MKKKAFGILLTAALLCGVLFLINRDLFHYEQIFVYKRAFSSEVDTKGDYILSTEQLALKPGTYRLRIEGSFKGHGNGFFLTDPAGEKFFFSEFPVQGTEHQEEFTVSGGTKQLRFGVCYDPDSEELTVERFLISSGNVLYRQSLYKHAVLSLLAVWLSFTLVLRIFFHEKYIRLFPHLSKPENERMVLFLLFLTLFTAAPFYRNDTFVNGDDFYYHMHHIRGIAASLKAGHFPVRILLEWLENYGYGSGFYYPNLFLTKPGILILLGFHPIAAYEIFVTICTFFALLTMFLTVRDISRTETAAYASAALYGFAAYRLADIYYRAALGEIQTFIFLPMIIWGLYEIFNGHTERWWIFAFAFTGLLWSHVISLALAGLVTAVWTLFHLPRIFKDRKIFRALFKSVILTLVLGAGFLLPMAEQSMTNELKINMIMFNADVKPFGSSSPWQSLFQFFYDWSYDKPLDAARRVYPGWPLLFIPVLSLLIPRRHRDPLIKLADELTIYGFVTMIMCTDIFPWRLFLQLLFRIQFAWRFMMISTVLLSVSCAIYSIRLTEMYLPGATPVQRLLPITIFCAVCGTPILIESLTNRAYPMDYYRYVERSNALSGSEYLPMDLDRETIEKTGDHVVCEEPGFEMLSGIRKGLSFTFSYRLPETEQDAVMRVPFIYYTGYRGYRIAEDGTGTEIPVSKDAQGLLTVTNGGEPEGTITVRYVKTIAQHAGDALSLEGLLFCIICFLNKKRKNSSA